MKFFKVLLTTSALFLSFSAYAVHIGSTISYGTGQLIRSDPHDINGGRISIWAQPNNFVWGPLNVYFDFSFAGWHASHAAENRNIFVWAIAPVVRLYIYQSNYVSPYIEGSIGAGLQSATKFGNRKLSINYTFQDRAGIGMAFGKQKNWFVDWNVIHYSNADIKTPNGGYTIPVMIDFGYKFM